MVDAFYISLTIDLYVAENLDHDTIKLPVIYLLDCTLNDCDLILKSANQVHSECLSLDAFCFPNHAIILASQIS